MLNKMKSAFGGRKNKGFTPLNPVNWNRQKRYLTGFTIIELLIVCAIIAILAAIIIMNFERSKERTRDAQRKSDLTRIAAALESYKVDNKVYPTSFIPPASFAFVNVSTLAVLPTGNYINSLPTDPLNQSSYRYASESSQYKLLAISETITADDSAAQSKAGDFYNYSALNVNNFKCFQVSSSNTALGWVYDWCE